MSGSRCSEAISQFRTNAPLPWRVLTSPSFFSRAIASRMTARLTPNLHRHHLLGRQPHFPSRARASESGLRSARATSSARLTLGSGVTFSLRSVAGICMLSDNLAPPVNPRGSDFDPRHRDVDGLAQGHRQRRAAAPDVLAAQADRYPARPVTLALPFPARRLHWLHRHAPARELDTVLGQGRSSTSSRKTGDFGIAALQHLLDNSGRPHVLVGNLTSNSMTPSSIATSCRFDYFGKRSLRSRRLPTFQAWR